MNLFQCHCHSKEILRDRVQVTHVIIFWIMQMKNSLWICKKQHNAKMTTVKDNISVSATERVHIWINKKTGSLTKKKPRVLSKDHFMRCLMDTPDFKQPITANKILRPSSNPSKTTIMTKQQLLNYNKFAKNSITNSLTSPTDTA